METDYPYIGLDDTCKSEIKTVYHIAGGYRFPPTGDNDNILVALKEHVIDTGVNASPFNFRYYKSGVVTEGCAYHGINHDVTLLGAGTDASMNVPYWRIKNSWGVNWGDKGFIRILRESGVKPAQCAMNLAAMYPL